MSDERPEASDPHTGISIRFIRHWRPSTSSPWSVEFWSELRQLLEARERVRVQTAYETGQTDVGQAVLAQLGIGRG